MTDISSVQRPARSLTGSQAQIILALYFAGENQTAEQIQMATGLVRRTIVRNLQTLAQKGLVEVTELSDGRRLWMLAQQWPSWPVEGDTHAS